MEKTIDKVEELLDNIRKLARTKIEALTLLLAEKVSGVIANIAGGIVSGVILMFSLFFGSVTLAIVLGEWMRKPWAGFLIVGVLYMLIGIVVWKGRKKWIQLPVMNAILEQIFKHAEKD